MQIEVNNTTQSLILLNPLNPLNPLNHLNPLNPLNRLNPLNPLNHLNHLNPLNHLNNLNPLNLLLILLVLRGHLEGGRQGLHPRAEPGVAVRPGPRVVQNYHPNRGWSMHLHGYLQNPC